MGLSYTGSSCLLVTMVSGYRRVPAPPARIIPFIIALRSFFRPGHARAILKNLRSLTQSGATAAIYIFDGLDRQVESNAHPRMHRAFLSKYRWLPWADSTVRSSPMRTLGCTELSSANTAGCLGRTRPSGRVQCAPSDAPGFPQQIPLAALGGLDRQVGSNAHPRMHRAFLSSPASSPTCRNSGPCS